MTERSQPYTIGSRFINPWPSWRHKSFSELLTRIWQMRWPRAPPASVLDIKWPVKKPTFSPEIDVEEVRATWLGHATVLFHIDQLNILCDPMFSDYSSPIQGLGPRRHRRPPCTIDQLPIIHAVVISHSHYDHLDYNSVSSINRRFPDLAWFVPRGCAKWMLSSGCKQVRELTWWESAELPGRPNVNFVFTPTQHWSARGIFDTDKILWGSWVIKTPRARVWFAGDTGYCDVFARIGEKYGPFDMAAIPIGAYGPRWFMRHQHIDPEEAVKIHQDVKAKTSLAIHWGTFIMTEEPFLEPPEKLWDALKAANLTSNDFFVVTHGETVVVRVDNDMKRVV